MTWVLGGLLVLGTALTAEYLWLRPTARTRLRVAVLAPLRRRARSARRTLAALTRAALLKPYQGHHAPHRRTLP